ncbi:hypothetical protein LSTR_LSTR012132 [Laodelphax striatellus]|uniref:Uncharacterized protein n=1 Tax=Laodelphax striatellus TaxID=195883 RepID=A0A482XQ52_LAOST|nr:hypothetical protein LSTR_LSTR012132 [Laodelphax striatellus]
MCRALAASATVSRRRVLVASAVVTPVSAECLPPPQPLSRRRVLVASAKDLPSPSPSARQGERPLLEIAVIPLSANTKKQHVAVQEEDWRPESYSSACRKRRVRQQARESPQPPFSAPPHSP